VLGALMALASEPWYGHALEDQHLAGLIMWMPAGLLYATFALARLVPLLREPRRAQAPGRVGDAW
jgi:hypothetical protein